MADGTTLDRCPACRSDEIGPDYVGRTTRDPADPARWSVWQCRRCFHGFINPQPSWTALAPYYAAGYRSYDPDHGIEDSIEKAAGAAREAGEYRHVAIRPGMRVLDVGCGGGSFLQVARALGAETQGVEPSAVAADRARSRGLEVFNGMLEDYVARRESDTRFDLITLCHVTEHVPDPAATLAVARDLLAPGGLLWVAVPNGACRFARGLQWRWHSTDLPVHIMQFSPASLRVTADRAELRTDRIYTYSLPKGVRSSLVLTMRHRWMIPGRIGRRLVSDRRVHRVADELDRLSEGEAIIAELRRAE